MGSEYVIDCAVVGDAPAIAAIYAHHVLHGIATFETVPPDAAEFVRRMGRLADAGHPWLVARAADGAVLGYTCAAQFRERAAYRYASEDSIYLSHAALGRGIGTALLARLLDAAAESGFRQMIAVIAVEPGSQPASIPLHARAGFEHAGLLRSVGRKHGKWLDVVYMQKSLGAGDATPPGSEP